jgi:hypothetical protein
MNPLLVGDTLICKWKDNKMAAYSIGGDDSLRSQLYFAIPEMDRRGIRGTWWVNPGRGGSTNFKKQDDAWANCWIACYEDWKAAASRGHDFANHTMHHLGAASYTQAEQEISQTARAIWEANPRQRLQLFLRGGGTTWGISEDELIEILNKYDCVQGRGGGIEDPTWEVNPSAATLRRYVDAAIREKSWHLVAFHGIGPNCEWGGPVDGEAFIALLDYVVEKRPFVWCGTHTEIHKYDQERNTAAVNLLEASSSRIRLKLTTAKDPRLYDYPLTLITRIPHTWSYVSVTRKDAILSHIASEGRIQYEAVPGMEEILITPV